MQYLPTTDAFTRRRINRARRLAKGQVPIGKERPTNIPCFRPAIGEEEIKAVAAVLRSGWLTTGPKAREFEQKFAAFLGGDVEAVAVSSATAGLHLAAEACGIGPGDEVIVPTLTFTATGDFPATWRRCWSSPAVTASW